MNSHLNGPASRPPLALRLPPPRRPPGAAPGAGRAHVASAAPVQGFAAAVQGFAETGEVKNGIWPRSAPFWLAAFYMALFIIRPWEELFPALGVIHFERIYAFFMIGVVLVSGKTRLRMNFQSLAVLVFLGGIGLCGLQGINPTASWETFYKYATLVVFYFVLLCVIRSPYQLAFMAACAIAVMGVYLAKCQWEFWVHGRHVFVMGVRRLIGIEDSFGGPNGLAMSVVISLPMLLFLWTIRRELTATWPAFHRKWFGRLLWCYFALAISSVVLTNSRSGMVGVAAFAALSALRGADFSRKLKYVALGAVALAGLWMAMPEESRGRIRTIWNPRSGPVDAQASAQGRIEGFRAGMTMFERFPLTGVGPGNFISYRTAVLDGTPLNAHNMVGEMLGETGLVGAFTFLLFLGALLWNCRKARLLASRAQGPAAAMLLPFIFAVKCSIVLLFLEGMFDHNLLRYNWLWLAVFAGLAVCFLSSAAALAPGATRSGRTTPA